MKTPNYQYITSILILLFSIAISVQIDAQEDIKSAFEKVYTQTDRPFYFPGETIWFKSYIVKEDNTVSNLSNIRVYQVHLIAPLSEPDC